MLILGIETSCDETAVSVVGASGPVEEPAFKLLGSTLMSQMKLHEKYGGVHPNLAKREHIKNLPIVLEKVLKESGVEMGEIDKIAVTVGPGLEPALWTGINFAQDLSKKYDIPVIPTNHMEGHMASVLLDENLRRTLADLPEQAQRSPLSFPALALLISGGHTELVYLKSWKEKEIVGETKDDAVGEAFDKVARMLGLSYPGGPEISKLAEKARELRVMNYEVRFPRPMIHSGDLNFSFSGLKTAVLYFLRKVPDLNEGIKMEVAREFEDAVVEVLTFKSRQAILKYNPGTFIIGGGVIANKKIRESFQKLNGEFPDLILRIPERELATDNAVMIAMAGYLSHISGVNSKMELKARGNLKYS